MAEGDAEISIELDADVAEKVVDALGQELEKPTPDKMAGAIADEVVQQFIEALRQNDSRVTGEGLESIESRHTGTGVYGIFSARYLDAVDEGTQATGRPPPVKNNTRLQEAAKKYGIDPYALAQSIANNGTDAHPFKEPAIEAISSELGDIAEEEMEKTLNKVSQPD